MQFERHLLQRHEVERVLTFSPSQRALYPAPHPFAQEMTCPSRGPPTSTCTTSHAVTPRSRHIVCAPSSGRTREGAMLHERGGCVGEAWGKCSRLGTARRRHGDPGDCGYDNPARTEVRDGCSATRRCACCSRSRAEQEYGGLFRQRRVGVRLRNRDRQPRTMLARGRRRDSLNLK